MTQSIARPSRNSLSIPAQDGECTVCKNTSLYTDVQKLFIEGQKEAYPVNLGKLAGDDRNRTVGEPLSRKLYKLLQLAENLLVLDKRTEMVTRPLAEYSNGLVIRDLDEGSAYWNSAQRTITLDQNFVSKLISPKQKNYTEGQVHIQILVALCHEACHYSQNISNYEDVQRMKSVDYDRWQERMGVLDLEADYVAAYTVSRLFCLIDSRNRNPQLHLVWFDKIWRTVCRSMLEAFSPPSRKGTHQRVFGYLLMSNLLKKHLISKLPLEFDAELWPDWSEDLTHFYVQTRGKPWIHGADVSPILMSQILDHLSVGKYDLASAQIESLWKTIPRG